jgi:hypothetical protein
VNSSSIDPPVVRSLPWWHPHRWDWKPKLRWFAAEIAVVVAGVLIALALNSWWQARQAAAGEESYLAFVSRDLGNTIDDIEELRVYEAYQIQGGLDAYRAISAQGRSPEQMAVVSDGILRLTSRRTLSLTNATYQDLLSTGNLQLIRNRELRDQIVAYHEGVEREFEIHNKNNTFFVDELFASAIIGSGLFFIDGSSGTTIDIERGTFDDLKDAFDGGYSSDQDPIWSFAYNSPEWITVKSQLLQRIKISWSAHRRAEQLLEETRRLKDAVDAELKRL